jgi:DNA-binding MarR family transcriptional regulator
MHDYHMHFFFQVFLLFFTNDLALKKLSAMKLTSPPAPATDLDTLETERFVISRVSTLNVLLKRRAAIYARRSFDFTLTEWRIVTLLRTMPPISLRELALEALIDAAQISRAAAGLVTKGYLTRKRSPLDNREALLTLTKRGRALSTEMCQASLERNEELLAGYSAGEVRALVATLDHLVARARTMVEEDERTLQ